jgi:hypothetical protein
MRESGLPPNQGLQRTALRADKIVAILKSDFGWIALSIYGCAAAEAQSVGPLNPYRSPATSISGLAVSGILIYGPESSTWGCVLGAHSRMLRGWL